MRKITLVCFGKLKTPGLDLAVGEFAKRLTRYTDFQVVELRPIPVPEKSETLRSSIPEKEAAILLELLESPGFKSKAGKNPELWCLDETGKALPTREWAKNLQELATRGSGELVLLIGGSLGLGDAILSRSHRKVSLGPQTLSHELARLILTEQLYRALSYLSGHPYHNEG
ncbi:MAG: 23S rRNA (pseudouridine(1915)-N(3))-methyltransferase RlmH [Bdellovibrionales bacterium]|nr:23S rRNA (pseudouridine(1915)-N(3))-methyltransferase RlmH [Bdellovibrionales bacterium]